MKVNGISINWENILFNSEVTVICTDTTEYHTVVLYEDITDNDEELVIGIRFSDKTLFNGKQIKKIMFTNAFGVPILTRDYSDNPIELMNDTSSIHVILKVSAAQPGITTLYC